MQPMPLIRASGSHLEAGRQIGAQCRDLLQRGVRGAPAGLPPGMRWEDMRRAAQPYLEAARQHLPWVLEEIEGAAQGAQVDLLDLMALATEEIWQHVPPVGKCSDFAAGPPATADGGIWLAHNNDLSAAAAEELVAVEWRVADDPPLFSLGVGGIFISVGCNAAGLSLTGNELSPNDNRLGVPRLLIVRDILAQRTAAAALAAADNPRRASSYNNLIAHTDGTLVNYEGSATDHALIPVEAGWTVHTNHYVAEKMLRYELAPDRIERSRARYARARELMHTRPGPVTPEMLRGFLSDHQNTTEALCRHSGPAPTVFWCIIDLNHGRVSYARGNPCQPGEQRFSF